MEKIPPKAFARAWNKSQGRVVLVAVRLSRRGNGRFGGREIVAHAQMLRLHGVGLCRRHQPEKLSRVEVESLNFLIRFRWN